MFTKIGGIWLISAKIHWWSFQFIRGYHWKKQMPQNTASFLLTSPGVGKLRIWPQCFFCYWRSAVQPWLFPHTIPTQHMFVGSPPLGPLVVELADCWGYDLLPFLPPFEVLHHHDVNQTPMSYLWMSPSSENMRVGSCFARNKIVGSESHIIKACKGV